MATLEQKFLALAHAAEVDSAKIDAVRSIADEALAAGDITLACRALNSSAYLLADNSMHTAALQLLDRSEQLATKAGLAIAHEAEYGRGHVYYQRGDFEASFRCFSELATGPRFKHLRLGVRCNVLTHLAQICRLAQADDAALHCIALADHEIKTAGATMAGPDRINRAHIAFWCWLANAPEFSSMRLFGADSNLPEASRATLLDDVALQCRAVVDQGHQQWPMSLHEATCQLDLVQAVQQNNRALVWRAVKQFEALGMKNLQFELDNWTRFLGVFLLLGAHEDAQGVVDRAGNLLDGAQTQRGPDLSLLLWRYLLSQLAQHQGRYEQALQLYQTFAAQTTQHLTRMNRARSELMTVITLRPGARAQHQPDRRPAYFEHARAALLASPRTPVADVARRVGVSERALREAFKVHAGISPKAFQLRAHLESVRQFVLSDHAKGMSVEEIAEAHGFSHASRFASTFKRHFGHSVAALRDAPSAPGAPRGAAS